MSLSVILPEKTKYRSETVDSREIDSPRSSLRFVRDRCGRSIDKTPRNDLARLLATMLTGMFRRRQDLDSGEQPSHDDECSWTRKRVYRLQPSAEKPTAVAT